MIVAPLIHAAEPTKPNVLFIAVDDLNDWVGCLGGHPDSLTPNIDRLAERGMLFTTAECAAPACIPSRSALMTGIAPAKSGLYGNLNGSFRMYPDSENHTTIPQYFSQNGYHSMGAGKILHHPNENDWDEMLKLPYFKNPMPAGPSSESADKDWRPADAETSEMTDWKMAQWTAEQLKRTYDKPFFLACGFYRPHLPWNVPKKYYDKFPAESLTLPLVKEDDRADLPKTMQRIPASIKNLVEDETKWRSAVQAYLACINFADECVGVLLDALDASEYRDNTIVVLWSDHGWHLGEKYHWSKFSLWEESARCVLICAAPGVKAGSECNQPVNLMDLYPTLLEMCALPEKENQSGISLVPLLKNPKTPRKTPSITASEKGFSLRTDQWRYIRYTDGGEELYDHSRDPNEWENLAENPEYKDIKEVLKGFLPENPVTPRRPPEKAPKKKKKKAKH